MPRPKVMSISEWRPYRSFSSDEILAVGKESIDEGNVETFSFCVAELRKRQSKRSRQVLSQLLESGPKPVYWIGRAAQICKKFKTRPNPDSPYSLYLVLLNRKRDRPDRSPKYDIYVGETSIPIERRFQNHLNGHRASRYVRKYGVQLLTTLTEHLHPLDREEARRLEADIAKALRAALPRLTIFGGH